MRTVSFQGVQLSATQRLRADQQARLRASMSGGLAQLVDGIDKALAEHKRTASEPYKPEKQWFLVSNEHGTPWVGDVFGF